MKTDEKTIVVNGRSYKAPRRPTVVICLDGSEPGYIEKAIEAGVAPTFARFMRDGAHVHANSVIPSFTNPNNLSIITGRPPSVHGIAGNYFYDVANDREVMMNDPQFLRAPTILAGMYDAGFKVAAVTAKDKLRSLLSYGLDYSDGRAIAFSSEKADQATMKANGIDDVLNFVGLPLPEVYSADLSEFVFAAGVKLVQHHRPDLMYLSTTDYIQHKVGPRHERQIHVRRPARRALPSGFVRRMARQGERSCHSADHRSLCCPSRLARLVCNDLPAGEYRCRTVDRPAQGHGRNRRRTDAQGGLRSFRVAGRPGR
jgi:phosphonoacetate hydrolase